MALEPTVSLTQEQIDFYHREGYLAIDSLTTQEEVERLQAIYDRLFSTKAGWDEGNQFDLAGTDDGSEPVLPQVLNPSKYAPELLETQLVANIRHVGKQLLGPLAEIGGDHAIRKPARIGVATPWHQDQAYWDPAFDYENISVWVPLQPATLENGCMQFVPGSHRDEIVEHRSIGDDPRVHGLEIPGFEPENVVVCPLPSGGATFHGPRMLHYTGPNTSDNPRRAYIVSVVVPAIPRETPHDFPWERRKQTARMQRAVESNK